MKNSKQRNMILDTVVNNPVHPTADMVYAQLKTENPNLSLGTVYRNLNLLSELGMLRKIAVPNGSDRFDGRLDGHYHIICDKCSRVLDIELKESDFEQHVEQSTGYKITSLDVVVKGICPECQGKNIH